MACDEAEVDWKVGRLGLLGSLVDRIIGRSDNWKIGGMAAQVEDRKRIARKRNGMESGDGDQMHTNRMEYSTDNRKQLKFSQWRANYRACINKYEDDTLFLI